MYKKSRATPLVVSLRLAWAYTPLQALPPSACGCRFGRGRSFGLSFERLCSPREKKDKTLDEAGV
jgi:hypothetical protein